MAFRTLIAPVEAAAQLGDPGWVFIDCTFALGDPDAGRTAYAVRHLPGATYAHLDDDLSGAVIPGRTGRHPLPGRDAFARTAIRLGITDGTQVVAYDAANGAMAAARLWWLLNWAGHDAVAVLDGGLARWLRDGLPTESGGGRPAPEQGTFTPRWRHELVADAETAAGAALLVDVRAEDRFRGENEAIDPVAGHIPGAINRPFGQNLRPDGTFLPAAELRRRHADDREATLYCGSGVTAAHTALAYAAAGLPIPRLYAGSWSEWITDPARPVATGE